MITDKNKGISNIEYNHLNLPIKVTMLKNSIESWISYTYNALGQKVEKEVFFNTGAYTSSTYTTYLDGFQYTETPVCAGRGCTPPPPNLFFPHPEGYVNKNNETDTFEYVYNYTDHLDNVRLAYQDKNGDGKIEDYEQDVCNWGFCYSQTVKEILEENNYYPFGLKHQGYNDFPNESSSTNKYKYQYNGKEFQAELGLNWNDYGARNYDPAIGRWMNVDPLAEEMDSWSPYNYTFNNPANFVDPDGMAPLTDYKLLANGKVERVDENDGSENNTNDRLYATDKEGNVVEDNVFQIDKENASDDTLITDLSEGSRVSENLTATETNDDTVVDLAYFVMDNSSVEWQLFEFNDKEENRFLLGTQHHATKSINEEWFGYQKSNVLVKVHNHPFGATPNGKMGGKHGDIPNMGSYPRTTRAFIFGNTFSKGMGYKKRTPLLTEYNKRGKIGLSKGVKNAKEFKNTLGIK